MTEYDPLARYEAKIETIRLRRYEQKVMMNGTHIVDDLSGVDSLVPSLRAAVDGQEVT